MRHFPGHVSPSVVAVGPRLRIVRTRPEAVGPAPQLRRARSCHDPPGMARFIRRAARGRATRRRDGRATLLDLAGVAAHASERTAAPIACWLVGQSGLDAATALERAERVTFAGRPWRSGRQGAAKNRVIRRGVRSTGASAGGRTVVAARRPASWCNEVGSGRVRSVRSTRRVAGHRASGTWDAAASSGSRAPRLFGERWMLHRRRDADRSMGHAHRRLCSRPTGCRRSPRSSSVTVVSSARAAASSPTPASTSATTCGWARTCSSPMRTTGMRIRTSRSAARSRTPIQ